LIIVALFVTPRHYHSLNKVATLILLQFLSGVNAVAQTEDGYIWLGTHKGLVRFDGIEFKVEGIYPEKEPRNILVKCLAPSRNG
jgi:hypothetical protein